jgi:hypothetical protein
VNRKKLQAIYDAEHRVSLIFPPSRAAWRCMSDPFLGLAGQFPVEVADA